MQSKPAACNVQSLRALLLLLLLLPLPLHRSMVGVHLCGTAEGQRGSALHKPWIASELPTKLNKQNPATSCATAAGDGARPPACGPGAPCTSSCSTRSQLLGTAAANTVSGRPALDGGPSVEV